MSRDKPPAKLRTTFQEIRRYRFKDVEEIKHMVCFTLALRKLHRIF